MPVLESPPPIAGRTAGSDPPILPTLFGGGDRAYRTHPGAFVASYALNLLIAGLLIWSGHWVVSHHEQIKQQVIGVVTDISPYVLPPSKTQAGGGGGGGDRDKLDASKGSPPKFAREQITPPAIIVRNEASKLPVEPTVIGPPELKLPQLGQIGDPLSNVVGPLSNGTGYGGGIGSGSGGGIGSGRGPGVGPGYGGGIGGGVYRVGGGVSAPRAVFAPDPEYSDEARKAKFQGTVRLVCVVGPDGRTRDIRVARSLGMGLDQKALEAVRLWRFDPAQKDGHPVAVEVSIEVNFRLY